MSSTAERVEWRGESWFVADARFDESPLAAGSHWHLTLTAPEPADYVPADLLRRALKNHDAIAAALRTGTSSKRLFKAIDDMRVLKSEAAFLGCYPAPTSVIRDGDDRG